MTKQKDALWKVVVEELFEDFLFFINPALAKSVDPGKYYEFINTELNQQVSAGNGTFEQRTVDTLVKIHTRQEKTLLLHLEVQDQYSSTFSQRMYNYFNKLYDKYKMPIVAYAIFIESNEIKRADTFDLNFMRTHLSYKFNTCKIAAMTDEYLTDHPSCFALAILIAKGTLLKTQFKNIEEYEAALLAYKLKIAGLIIKRELSVSKEIILLKFLFHYINFEFTLTNAIFEEGINLLMNKNVSFMTFDEVLLREIKIEERLEGRLEGKEEVIAGLIVKYGFTNREIAEIANIPVKLVGKIRAKLMRKQNVS